jgi:hypothetical protein
VTVRSPGPRPGEVVFIGRAASVQFAGNNGFNFRIIRVDDTPTYAGWVWIEGYQLGPDGDAVERRRIFVLATGLRPGRQQQGTGSTGSHRRSARVGGAR